MKWNNTVRKQKTNLIEKPMANSHYLSFSLLCTHADTIIGIPTQLLFSHHSISFSACCRDWHADLTTQIILHTLAHSKFGSWHSAHHLPTHPPLGIRIFDKPNNLPIPLLSAIFCGPQLPWQMKLLLLCQPDNVWSSLLCYSMIGNSPPTSSCSSFCLSLN